MEPSFTPCSSIGKMMNPTSDDEDENQASRQRGVATRERTPCQVPVLMEAENVEDSQTEEDFGREYVKVAKTRKVGGAETSKVVGPQAKDIERDLRCAETSQVEFPQTCEDFGKGIRGAETIKVEGPQAEDFGKDITGAQTMKIVGPLTVKDFGREDELREEMKRQRNEKAAFVETNAKGSVVEPTRTSTSSAMLPVMHAEKRKQVRHGTDEDKSSKEFSLRLDLRHFIDEKYEKLNLSFIHKIEGCSFSTALFKDNLTNRLVVRKYVPKEKLSEVKFDYKATMLRRFGREDDHFLTICGSYEIKNRGTVTFTNYFDGWHLDNLFMHRLLTPQRLQKILQKVLEGVNFLKNNCIIHCDINGHNILVNEANEIKITGFGRSVYNYETKERFGKAGYAAPEVLAQWYRENPRAPSYPCDVYSVGATFFYYIFDTFAGYSSRYLLEEDVNQETYDVVINSGIPIEEDGVHFERGLDPLLEDLLKHLLDPNPNSRLTAEDALRHMYFVLSPKYIRLFLNLSVILSSL